MRHLPTPKKPWWGTNASCFVLVVVALPLLSAVRALHVPTPVVRSRWTWMNGRASQLYQQKWHEDEGLLGSNPDDNDDKEEYAQDESVLVTRRRALSQTAATAGMALFPTSMARADDDPDNDNDDDISRRTILITGCNSGIGYDAARRFADRGHDVFLACRTLEKATDAVRRIQEDVGNAAVGRLIPAECNLAHLASVESFVTQVVQPTLETSKTQLDVVCLNAGVARNVDAKDVARTQDGFELTVGTNHLGHFYLHHLLLPMVKKQTGRFVITASAVHDPESRGGAQGKLATLGDLSGLEKAQPRFDMVDGGEFNADKAYKDSKLCNVFFTRELQRRLTASGTGIKANCFSPGLIVGTGLFRDQNPLFTKVFDIAATNVFKVGETVEWGGGALEYMALEKTMGRGLYYAGAPGASARGDEAYGNEFKPMQVSQEALEDAKGRRLWTLSERLVGIAA